MLVLAMCLVFTIFLELILTKKCGLRNLALSQADPNTGYLFQPNQKVRKLGRYIEYNQFSQRTHPIQIDKGDHCCRILMLGDSVLNGGNPIDQSLTISELLKQSLKQLAFQSITSFEVLNASAGSWGIGNQLGYLCKFGTFDSDLVILQIGTHDLIQLTSDSSVVGRASHPDRLPKFAILELLLRYLYPRLIGFLTRRSLGGLEQVPMPKDRASQFLKNMSFLEAIIQLVRLDTIPVLVLFTPSREDIIPTFKSPEFKSEFLKILSNHAVPLIDVHADWSQRPPELARHYFRDDVHLTVAGNRAIATLTSEHLCRHNLVFH